MIKKEYWVKKIRNADVKELCLMLDVCCIGTGIFFGGIVILTKTLAIPVILFTVLLICAGKTIEKIIEED